MIRRRKLESVGSFSVNLLLYDGSDEAKSHQEEQPMYASLPDGDCSEPYNSEIDELSRIEIDHEGESYSPSCDELCSIASTPTQAKCETNTARPCTPLPLFLRSSNPPKIAIEGSFLAACSSTNSSFFEEPSNDMNDDSSSNSSSSSTTSNINFGPCSWDDGLITIDEEASVKMW